ncbi:hypothetical protein SAMN05216436_11445 [bacterium A37T11]|nr:hypothetical protein SAMN05216436_11445 [bacterium A37T11]
MFGTTATDYIDGIEWEDTKLNIIQTEEGRAVNTTSNGYAYEYFLKDHLGNTRSGFAANSQTTSKFVSNYYPFGLSYGQGVVTTPKNRYFYPPEAYRRW